jgi:hypothetical protein
MNEIRRMNEMGAEGWEVIKILEPRQWLNSNSLFIRIYYKRKKQTE